MPAISDLQTLLASISPELQAETFVFVVVASVAEAQALEPVGIFVEAEGVTAICRRERAAAAGLRFDGTFRQIVLRVHSSLNAVGFLAAVSRALADAGIPCNAVSAFYHDHIFVPEAEAKRGLAVLTALGRAE